MGKITRTMRFHHGTPVIRAASSISPDNCSMAFTPLRLAKGRYLTEPTSASSAKPRSHATCEDAPKASEGIKYGKKDRLLTQEARRLPRRLATP